MINEYDDFDDHENEENDDNGDNEDYVESENKDDEVELHNMNAHRMDSTFTTERRNSKRFDEKLSAIIENENCVVLNVSDKGVLLQTNMPVYFFPLSKTIEFQLNVEGEWISILGKIQWIQSDVLHSKLGLYIQYAPETYFNFLRTLYE